jgi:hypothetical protein
MTVDEAMAALASVPDPAVLEVSQVFGVLAPYGAEADITDQYGEYRSHRVGGVARWPRLGERRPERLLSKPGGALMASGIRIFQLLAAERRGSCGPSRSNRNAR